MAEACSTHGRKRHAYNICLENLKGSVSSENISVVRKIILE
jgi:hypothetical protein